MLDELLKLSVKNSARSVYIKPEAVIALEEDNAGCKVYLIGMGGSSFEVRNSANEIRKMMKEHGNV